MERAPYSIDRLARAIARGDDRYHVQFGPMKDIPGAEALEFRGGDEEIHGWILLNTRKEPVVWATTQYSYSFGPLERYGNLRVPRWAITCCSLRRPVNSWAVRTFCASCPEAIESDRFRTYWALRSMPARLTVIVAGCTPASLLRNAPSPVATGSA